MVVKNLNRTRRDVCRCGTWLTHWQRYGKPGDGFLHRQACSVVVCGNPIQAGGFVQKEVLEGMGAFGMVGDASWYIIPLCSECNRRQGASLTIEDDCGLAPASTLETCERHEVEPPRGKVTAASAMGKRTGKQEAF
jgi:hypothetical protein